MIANNVPNLVGYPLDIALKIFEKSNVNATIFTTSPINEKTLSKKKRILKQEKDDKCGILLIVAYEMLGKEV